MAETPHIARGFDFTLIGLGTLLVVAAIGWWVTDEFSTPRVYAIPVGVIGAVCVLAGLAIMAYASLRYGPRRR